MCFNSKKFIHLSTTRLKQSRGSLLVKQIQIQNDEHLLHSLMWSAEDSLPA